MAHNSVIGNDDERDIMKKFYILNTSRKLINEFFEENDWSWDYMTSIILQKENDNLIQVFGSHGSYGYVGEEVQLIADQSCKSLGYATIVKEYGRDEYKATGKNIVKNITSTYVFK